jgi:D-alanyl-D-alanine carboxypeptidase
LVVDAQSGAVISSDAPNHLWYPASLTKLMTVYIALAEIKAGRLRFEDVIVVSQHAALQNPVNFGLRPGQKITVRQAIDAAIVVSGNDAAVALAETIAESEDAFATLMTGTARELGMTRTVFQNATGLPADGQVTTARDMALLALAIVHQFPEHYTLFGQRRATIGKRSRGTVNGILDAYAGADGMKTGFTCASGYNLVASAERDGRRLIGVVLGSKNGGERTVKMRHLLDEAFAVTAPSVPTVIGLAEVTMVGDDEQPPTVLSTRSCASNALVGSGVIESPLELSGWAIALGDFRTRAKAEQALRNAQSNLGKKAGGGRPAIVKRGDASWARYNVMLVGMKQASARVACRQLQDVKEFCVVLSPKVLQTRFAASQ